MTSSIYKEVLAALRLEYAVEHNGKEPKMLSIYWQYVAEKIFAAFHDIANDECLDWADDLVQKHKEALLAAFPDWADDEYNFLYQEK